MRGRGKVSQVELWKRARYEFRVFLACAIALASAVGITIGATRAERAASGSLSPTTVEVVVAPGDTLWSIARRHVGKDVDLRVAVDDIIARNRLSSTTLRPGQVLVVEIDEASCDEAPRNDRVAAVR
ncbi:MAG: LysM peptidoglycan-binding domain-containing protein [Firmicutes bacterium]|nr:LysM peptidoglycan-binding domain-containing protein [Bacillota bacterium]